MFCVKSHVMSLNKQYNTATAISIIITNNIIMLDFDSLNSLETLVYIKVKVLH
jgi:hypothetical protein